MLVLFSICYFRVLKKTWSDRGHVAVIADVIVDIVVIHLTSLETTAGTRGTLRRARNGDTIFAAVLVVVIRLVRVIYGDAVSVITIGIARQTSHECGCDRRTLRMVSENIALGAFRIMNTVAPMGLPRRVSAAPPGFANIPTNYLLLC